VRVLHRQGAPAERRAALTGLGVETVETAASDSGMLDMVDALRRLAAGGITRVLCALFTAGKAFGGDGVPGVASFGLDRLTEAPGFELASVEPVGGDVLSLWQRCADR
jgi:diaminohydroxyphosphoribosylaminopyrimidine deaminase/5-amino-6-(5-phosphoribosylamino)uracil reductase